MNHKLRLLAAALPLAFAATAHAVEEAKKDAAPTPDWSWTAHVDVNSAYYLRGITNTYGNNKWIDGAPAAYGNRGGAKAANGAGDAPESRDPALQWGFDVNHSSGFYLGYWGSQLTYSYDRVGKSFDTYRSTALATAGTVAAKRAAAGAAVTALNPAPFTYYSNSTSIENDLYGGYAGKVGELGYNIGLTYYVYSDGTHSNAPESKLALSYGEFGAAAQTLLEDTIWGNKGDTYWTATWTKPLPYDLTFTANLGYYTYTKDGTYLGSNDPLGSCGANTYFFVNGCYLSVKSDGVTANPDAHAISGGFRHLILGVSQPIGATGLTWNAQAIIGGVNRFNVRQDDKVTAGISYAF
ncbi:MAG: hypothetical protein KJ787_04865 [Gammaproteobacteria bacterium]|nr:hypothetical protein [Gammaproteobacteria bacterium]MBU1645645.1 hypothetical protein [Gammaproteobacteria bacterium]MBU1973553.1 hypothetical protein [Gammaproteobacteria bacterium]